MKQNLKKETMKYILLTLFALIPLMSFAAETPKEQDPLKTSLAEMVREVSKTTNDGKSFIVEQAPDYFRQVLAWQALACKTWAWITGIAALLLILLAVFAFCDDEETFGFWACCFVIALLFSTGGNIIEIYKIKTAPKVYLVEYAKYLAK